MKEIAQFKRVHDFGVNSVDIVKMEENRLCIVSGGDDQQIAVMVLE